MAFEREIDVTKDAIEDKEITFFIPGSSNVDDVQSGNLSVQIQISSGEILTRNYDLLLRLTDDAAGLVHLSNLVDLRDYITVRLDTEVLPL